MPLNTRNNIQTFNQLYQSNNELIRKALTTAAGVGEGLIPENLEQVITNQVLRLVPELQMPVIRNMAGKFHDYNRLISIPPAGSAMGEASITPIQNSNTVRDFEQLKVMKRKGAVTGFMQDTAREYINPITYEMQTHLQSFGYDMRTYMLYGNSGADPYSFNGIEKRISTDRRTLTGLDKVQTNLALMDSMVDNNADFQGNDHRRVFLMSPKMLSATSRLWTTIRDSRDVRTIGTTGFEVPGGYRLENYRGVPIFETSATRPRGQMTTVTLADAGAGGAIPDDTYYFRVAPVTWDGEQGGSAESNSIATSNSDTITLSFTAYPNTLFYKVYCSDTDGSEVLVRVFSAFAYDGVGTPTAAVTSLVFTSDPTVADATSVPVHMQSDIPLEYSAINPDEQIIFWDLDEFQGLGKMLYTNVGGSELDGLITHMELAITDDNFPFLLKSYPAMIPSLEKTSSLIRGVRVS